MTHHISSTEDQVLVAIDIAKIRNDVLVEQPDGKRKAFKMANKMTDFVEFTRYLKAFGFPCLIGFEATGNYHRPLAWQLGHGKRFTTLGTRMIRRTLRSFSICSRPG